MDDAQEQSGGRTGRKQGEHERLLAELEESRRLFQRIAETSPNAIYVYDLVTGRTMYASARGEQITGHMADAVTALGDRFAVSLWHPDDVPTLPEHRRRLRALADDEIYESEYRVLQPDGTYRWLRSRTSVFARAGDGQVRQIVSVTQDATERKEAEERLAYHALLLENVDEAIVAADEQLVLTAWNRAAEEMYGWTAAEVLGRDIREVVRSEYGAGERERAYRVLAETGYFHAEAIHHRKDGTAFYIEGSIIALRNAAGQVTGYIYAFHDVTERKQAQIERERLLTELEESRRLFQRIAETSPDAIYVYDLVTGRTMYASARGEQIMGYTADEVTALGNRFAVSLWHPDDVPTLPEHRRRLQALADDEIYESEYRLLQPDGTYRWLRSHTGVFARAGAGQVRQIISVMQDVTERKRAELTQTQLAAIVESSDDAIVSKDLEGMILSWNAGAERTYGYSATEMLGRPVATIVPPERLDELSQILKRLKRGDHIDHYETERVRKDGSHLHIALTISPIKDAAGTVVAASTISRDITGQKWVEEALQRARNELEVKVAERTRELAEANAALQVEVAERRQVEQARQDLLGQLVSAQEEERRRIAHELHDSLGQYLTALHLGLKSVQALEGCPTPVADSIQKLRELALRIDEEVERLAFELRPPALDDLGLADALRWQVQQWSAASGTKVDLHTGGFNHERLPALVETTLYRIVQEALTNVHKHAAASRVSLIVERRHDEVLAIIEDDGRGFDPGALQRRPRRLGLRGMAERAQLAGGRLDVESEPGAGTTIYIHIPLPGDQDDGG